MERGVSLSAGIRVTFETVNLSAGSDPILHLLRPGDLVQVGFDDDSGDGPAARLSYLPPRSGTYVLLLRAATNETDGTADVLMDGETIATRQPFGGWQVTMDGLRASEEIWSVKLPSGAPEVHRLYILASGSDTIAFRQAGGGTAGAARFITSSAMGTRRVILAAPTPGPARLVRNDARLPWHDVDGDGLGTELEAVLQTCSHRNQSVGGFWCGRTADARDSDGDGLSDAWEVLGRRDAEPHQPLPAWGANPRHKDLFVEFDFRRAMPSDDPIQLSVAEAREFAAIYADQLVEHTPYDIARDAQTLRNPDGRNGIRAHLDIGVDPETTTDATIFGDWGGFTSVAPVKQDDGSYEPANAATVWKTAMEPVRRGSFRYGMVYAGDAGKKYSSLSWVAGANGRTHAHEAGHTMGLGHSGPSPQPIDVNCKPNYASVMNYAFTNSNVGFSHGFLPGPLNNTSLREYKAVPVTATNYLDVLEDDYDYWVDRANGHVDWDRNGVFAPADTTVRAYANYQPRGSCEYTKYSEGSVRDFKTDRSPAIVRLAGRLYVFAEDGDRLRFARAAPFVNCAPSPTEPCAIWTGVGGRWMDATGGVDVAKIGNDRALVVTAGDDGVLRWATARATSFPSLVWSPVQVIAGSELAGGEPSLAAMSSCSVYLAYGGQDDSVIRLQRWSCEDGWSPAQVARNPDGDELVASANASPAIVRAHLGIGPVLLGAFPRFGGLDIRIYDPGKPPLFPPRWEPTSLLGFSRPTSVQGKPAVAWVGQGGGRIDDGAQGATPRLYIVTITDTDEGKLGGVEMSMSYVDVTGSGENIERHLRVGLVAFYQNSSYRAYGVDLYHEFGADSNLRAAVARGGSDWGGQVFFRPLSDGIVDYDYPDFDDWRTMADGLCKGVVNPGGLVDDPITCWGS
ncbi:MAG TPA: hypothetical protein VFR38_16260 [Gaiellaceae bacterium]|nr:hypothetical protein [Gaiellaceae bacterium]